MAPSGPAERSAATPPGASIDLGRDDIVAAWCEHFGATPQQLEEAVQAVGSDPAAVREHLLNQGASSGAG